MPYLLAIGWLDKKVELERMCSRLGGIRKGMEVSCQAGGEKEVQREDSWMYGRRTCRG